MARRYSYFSIGTTLANMVNVQTYTDYPPKSVPDRAVALTGSVKRRTLAGVTRGDGWVNSSLFFDYLPQTNFDAFMWAVFGGYTTEDAAVYITALDESKHYSPFSCRIAKPTFNLIVGGDYQNVTFPLTDCTLETANKTSNFTVTTSTHHLTATTSGGSVTFALPAVAGVTAYVPYSFIKLSSANSMILDPNSTEQIAGASTLTVTTQYERVDIYTDGSAWYRI